MCLSLPRVSLQPVSLEPSRGAEAPGAHREKASMPLQPYGSHLPPLGV